MLEMIAFAVLVCIGALALGQSILRLCGAQCWSWFAAPVGISTMILVSAPALSVPGRSMTTAVVLGLAVAGALVHILPHPAHHPPILGLLAGVSVFLLALLPFVAAGRAGTLGMSFNNDMALHLLWADGYRSGQIAALNPPTPTYPLGPHSLVATLAEGFGTSVEPVFAGLTIASTVLLAWTALSALRTPCWWGVLATAPLVGMTYLIAGYYGQGSFKEMLQALLIMAVASFLGSPPRLSRRLRWVPFGLLIGGILSVYSHVGLAWPLAFVGLWIAGVTVRRLRTTRSLRDMVTRIQAEGVGVLVGLGALLIAISPQLPRISRFVAYTADRNGTGIESSDIGNLAGPIPLWEAFGIWDSPDYRVPGPTPFENGMWTAFVVGLVVFGIAWALRRNEWMLPGAIGASLLIWAASERIQSPYVAAKGLVLVAPLLMLVALRPLVERDAGTRQMPSWLRLAAPAVVVVLVIKCLGSSWGALTYSKVGTTTHARELRSLAPLLDGKPTLYLGNDDFTRWIFADVPVNSPVIGFPAMILRPEKPWEYGRNYDIDSVDTATLNSFDWVVTPRDPAGSAFPPELVLARRTRSFEAYRRTGTIPTTQVLQEGEAAATRLDCGTPAGRAIAHGGGVATVRRRQVSADVPVLAPGATARVELPLRVGQWDLVTPYIGPRPVEVTSPGLRVTLPANLARPGPRWPIGRITVTRDGAVPVSLRPTRGPLTPDSALTYMTAIVAVPVGSTRTVPVGAACGQLVDWYRPAQR